TGLYVWRWLTTLVAFSLVWMTTRRMGARGFVPLLALVWGALIYRGRSQVRPETLAPVLVALTVWLLELRRARVRAGVAFGWCDPIFWLVPVVWIWVTAPLSWFLAFVLLGVHALDLMMVPGRRPPPLATLKRLVLTASAMLAVALLNPFGWE